MRNVRFWIPAIVGTPQARAPEDRDVYNAVHRLSVTNGELYEENTIRGALYCAEHLCKRAGRAITCAAKKLNVEFMMRGYFFAASSDPELESFGDFGLSKYPSKFKTNYAFGCSGRKNWFTRMSSTAA
jgi:hypothetical protein